jgi:hypothetical protein
MLRQRGDRALIGESGCDVGPLTRVRTLGEETAEGVERIRRLPQDPVSVLVDEADRR